MFKNIDLKTLFLSKTFWAGVIAFGTGAVHAYGQWMAGDKAGALLALGTAFSLLLGAIGIKDATSGPVN